MVSKHDIKIFFLYLSVLFFPGNQDVKVWFFIELEVLLNISAAIWLSNVIKSILYYNYIQYFKDEYF